MDIKDKIAKIMAKEHLSSSAFADRIGVPRSTISHILSGRNKPSLDLVQKILLSFPNYEADWLILDKGESVQKPKQSGLFDTIKQQETTIGESHDKEVTSNDTTEYTNVNSTNKPRQNDQEGDLQQVKQEEAVPYVNLPAKHVNKEVEQIIICYSDKTFTTYKPN